MKYLVAFNVNDNGVDIDSQIGMTIWATDGTMRLDVLCDINTSLIPVRHVAMLLDVWHAGCFCGCGDLICDSIVA